ncbi:MAG: UbiA family prenyltransferase [Chitinophagales bacterium]|jgi:4-hydroxybenzoate polyprenyltransferase|nr:UbiA family prenyltransferase [Chitinophagales bacterium]
MNLKVFISHFRILNVSMVMILLFLLALKVNLSFNFEFFRLYIITFLMSLYVYFQNNYFDYELDTQCKKIARIYFSPDQYYKIQFLFLSCFLILVSYRFQYRIVYLVSICLVLSELYNRWAKKWPLIGNLIVSFVSIMPLIYLYSILGVRNLEFLTFLVFIFTWLREWVKDIIDLACDNKFGYLTLPIILSKKSLYFLGGVIFLSGLLISRNLIFEIYDLKQYVLMFLLLILYYVAFLLVRPDYYRASLLLKYALFFCYIYFLFS